MTMNLLILLTAVCSVNSLELGRSFKVIENKFRINEKLLQLSKNKRSLDPTFYGHPKTRDFILARKFNILNLNEFDQTNSLVQLLVTIAKKYLHKCPTFIYYDQYEEKLEGFLLEKLFMVCFNIKNTYE